MNPSSSLSEGQARRLRAAEERWSAECAERLRRSGDHLAHTESADPLNGRPTGPGADPKCQESRR
jgi:hypothetical protein